MNLQEFIDHRSICPICNTPTVLTFHSQKKQKLVSEYGNHVFIFEMRGLQKKQQVYQVGFSFNPATYDFNIEFYTDKKRLDDRINLTVIERFKEFYENLGVFKMHLHCKECYRYSLISDPVELDFQTCKMEPLTIFTEYFGLSSSEEEDGNDRSIYRLTNYPKDNISNLVYFKSDGVFAAELYQKGFNYPYLELPLIKFISSLETTNRLNKLLIFS